MSKTSKIQKEQKLKQQQEEDKNSTSEESFIQQQSGRQLTNLELIKKAEECVDTLKLEKAVSLYEEGLIRFPNDTLILDSYTDLLIQMGEDEKAKKLIERSIQLNPNKDGRKYLNYAEMLEGGGIDQVQMYKKGIQVLEKDISLFKMSGMQDDMKLCVKQQASAYSAIAEIYMTQLCDEENAEQECEQCLQIALQIDPNNIDALQSLANLRMVRARDKDAGEALSKVVKLTLELVNSSDIPTIEFRLQTVRLLEDLNNYKSAVKILDTVIQEDDEVYEAWYHLAFCHYQLKKYKNGKECLKNLRDVMIKNNINDAEIKTAGQELYDKIVEALTKLGVVDEDMNEGKEGDKDEEESGGYETVSYEDVSDNDEEMKE